MGGGIIWRGLGVWNHPSTGTPPRDLVIPLGGVLYVRMCVWCLFWRSRLATPPATDRSRQAGLQEVYSKGGINFLLSRCFYWNEPRDLVISLGRVLYVRMCVWYCCFGSMPYPPSPLQRACHIWPYRGPRGQNRWRRHYGCDECGESGVAHRGGLH